MAGYKDYSMSNNAVEAYAEGEKPLSKWNKTEILDAIEELRLEILPLANKLTVKELKYWFLRRSSWHHTSMHFNETNFYSLDQEYVESFSVEKLNNIINNRQPKIKRSKIEIEQDKAEKERKRIEREYVKICKELSQNMYFCNDKAIRKCTNDELINQIKYFNEIKMCYSAKSNYKTIRGYTNAILSGKIKIEY